MTTSEVLDYHLLNTSVHLAVMEVNPTQTWKDVASRNSKSELGQSCYRSAWDGGNIREDDQTSDWENKRQYCSGRAGSKFCHDRRL